MNKNKRKKIGLINEIIRWVFLFTRNILNKQSIVKDKMHMVVELDEHMINVDYKAMDNTERETQRRFANGDIYLKGTPQCFEIRGDALITSSRYKELMKNHFFTDLALMAKAHNQRDDKMVTILIAINLALTGLILLGFLGL